MPYVYVDDIAVADIAFRAWGETLEDAFKASAEATVHAMVENYEAITPLHQRRFEVRDASLDLLLLKFLQEFIYYKDAEQLFLRIQTLTIMQNENGFVLQGCAAGERIDPVKHELEADVKGVTLHQLQVKPIAEGWQTTVVLDV